MQTEITSTEDLHEALFYFCPSEIDTSLESLSMRVSIQVTTRVSLSDYDSSIWGGSDEEGTQISGSSQGTQSRASIKGRAKKAASVISSRSSTTSQSVISGPNNHSNVLFRTGSSSPRIGPSPLTREYQNDNLSRWMGNTRYSSGTNSSQTNGNYQDALASLQDLSVEEERSSTEDSDESTGTRGPNTKRRWSRRSPVALEDGTSIHQGVQCKSCNMSPIIGFRYHCASCVQGADFVSVLFFDTLRESEFECLTLMWDDCSAPIAREQDTQFEQEWVILLLT